MTTTTTAGGRTVPASLSLTDDQALALVTPGAMCSPWTPAIGRAASLLCDVLDVATLPDAVSALTYSGARHALVAAVSAAQHGATWDEIGSDEGDGTIAASFLSLAIATARLVRAEDDAVATSGEIFTPGTIETWREYVERCGRVALVRSLRAAMLTVDQGSDEARRERATDERPWSRVPAADDPAVTAPRATRKSRSPGAAVTQPPRSRSERRRDAFARAAMVTADAMGGELDRLLGTGDKGWQQSIVGDPWCPIGAARTDADEPHACSARCFGLGGLHAYSPRQGRCSVTLPAGVAGPVAPERDVSLVWRPFHAFPVGSAVVRDYLPTDEATRERGKVRLVWTPRRARQAFLATVKGRRVTFTPATFPRATGNVARVPARTAAHLAAGGRFDQAVRTAYDGYVFVGHVRQREVEQQQARPSRKRAARVARDRRTLTPQQTAVVTLVSDALALTMWDGRSRVAHRDDQGRGWVVARTSDATLTLLSPAGVTSPLPTDPRRVQAAIRAAVLAS